MREVIILYIAILVINFKQSNARSRQKSSQARSRWKNVPVQVQEEANQIEAEFDKSLALFNGQSVALQDCCRIQTVIAVHEPKEWIRTL